MFIRRTPYNAGKTTTFTRDAAMTAQLRTPKHLCFNEAWTE